MEDADAVLVRILAATDAVWRPMRAKDWSGRTAAVLLEARRRYPEVGIDWHGRAATETARKQQQRTLEDAAANGYLRTFGRIRRNSVRLTGAGELRARSLAGLPGLSESLDAVCLLLTEPVMMPSELVLIGLPAFAYHERPDVEGELAEQMFRLAPALLREWIEARCDRDGRTYFTVTTAGKCAAINPLPAVIDLPRRREEAWELYHDEFKSALAQLRETEPDSFGELGYIPLSVSLAGADDPRVKLKEVAP